MPTLMHPQEAEPDADRICAAFIHHMFPLARLVRLFKCLSRGRPFHSAQAMAEKTQETG
ncbi:MAG: hypothetical protein LW833_15550 [Hyphomicrobiales bacterium]|nr:hypothetical protein [Hyphomicrobiales bacterium]